MKNDKYYEPIIIKGKGYIARVYKPILTEEERARRMKEIEKSAAELLMSVEKKKTFLKYLKNGNIYDIIYGEF